jgi:hypothetical protein
MACEMQVGPSSALLARLLGNSTNSRLHGASPKGACWVGCRRRAICHPKVLLGRLGGGVRGSGVSRQKATWQNSEIVGPYDADAIRHLKERVPGGIYVSGSGTLARAMLADGLADELHLFVYPLTLGAGPRLFDETARGKFALADSAVYDNGVVYLRYHQAT